MLKFKTTKNFLLKAIQSAQRGISSISSVPILQGILIEVEKEKATCIGTDMDFGIKYFLDVESNGNFSFVVPPKILGDIVSNLASDEIEITSEQEKATRIKITQGKSKYEINCLDSEGFPQFPKFKEKEEVIITGELLKELIEKTSFAASKDETQRQVLTGVLFVKKGKLLTLVATNAHRLSLCEKEINFKGKDTLLENKIIVPAGNLSNIAKVLDFSDEIKVYFKENSILMASKEALVFSRLIEGEFPPYERVVPTESNKQWIVNTQEFKRAVRGASVVAKESGNIINLESKKDEIKISAENAEAGMGEESIAIINKTGEDIKISFNANYLLDCLPNISEDEVWVGLNEETTPVLLTAKKDKSFKYVLMPIRQG